VRSFGLCGVKLFACGVMDMKDFDLLGSDAIEYPVWKAQ
jgi:hypothetical protein